MRGARYFYGKAIAMVCFLSSIGGPVILYDQLKPRLGGDVAFCVVFAPAGLMMLGALDWAEHRGGARNVWWLRLQLLGTMIVLLMHLGGSVILAIGKVARPDQVVNIAGIVVGIPLTILVFRSVYEKLDRPGSPRGESSPLEPG